jgi:hypothetical protein
MLLRSAVPAVLAALLAVAPTVLAATGSKGAPTEPPETATETVVAPDGPVNCPVTRPPAPPFVPPTPYPAKLGNQQLFWFGTDRLWTILPRDGMWLGLRHYSPTTPGFRQKIFWWSKGYDWLLDPTPSLTVTGKRLDGPAPPFFIPQATNGYNEGLESFMLVGADIPAYGCWEITGRFKKKELKFVIWVGP